MCDVCILYVVFMYVQMWVFVCVSVCICVCLSVYAWHACSGFVHAYVCMCVCACICKSQTYFRNKVGFDRTKLHFQ